MITVSRFAYLNFKENLNKIFYLYIIRLLRFFITYKFDFIFAYYFIFVTIRI